MPFRLSEGRTKIQFVTFTAMPSLIFRGCKASGVVSNTRYIQEAVCEKLARDLDIPLATLYAQLPEPKGPAKFLHDGTRHVPGKTRQA